MGSGGEKPGEPIGSEIQQQKETKTSGLAFRQPRNQDGATSRRSAKKGFPMGRTVAAVTGLAVIGGGATLGVLKIKDVIAQRDREAKINKIHHGLEEMRLSSSVNIGRIVVDHKTAIEVADPKNPHCTFSFYYETKGLDGAGPVLEEVVPAALGLGNLEAPKDLSTPTEVLDELRKLCAHARSVQSNQR